MADHNNVRASIEAGSNVASDATASIGKALAEYILKHREENARMRLLMREDNGSLQTLDMQTRGKVDGLDERHRSALNGSMQNIDDEANSYYSRNDALKKEFYSETAQEAKGLHLMKAGDTKGIHDDQLPGMRADAARLENETRAIYQSCNDYKLAATPSVQEQAGIQSSEPPKDDGQSNTSGGPGGP